MIVAYALIASIGEITGITRLNAGESLSARNRSRSAIGCVQAATTAVAP